MLAGSAGMREEGLALMRDTSLLEKALYGIDHPQGLTTTRNLVDFLLDDRDTYGEALALCDEAI